MVKYFEIVKFSYFEKTYRTHKELLHDIQRNVFFSDQPTLMRNRPLLMILCYENQSSNNLHYVIGGIVCYIYS